MTKQKSTKRALLMSGLALLMCVSMLIGSTFAWFTDSVTSGSNVIQSGKLDIVMEYWDGDSWEDAEGKVLEFRKASTSAGEEVLWEPGCTYELPKIRIRNEGNLAAYVVLRVNGITGDEELLKVIKFTTKVSNTPASLLTGSAANAYKNLEANPVEFMYGTPDGTVLMDWSLAGKGMVTPGTGHTDTSAEFTISGHMDESAGNEYQDLSIESVSITAIATQQVYEYDSFGREYDKGASIANATFVHGGTYNMDADRSEGINISPDAEVTVNGNHHVINVDGTGFQNSGDATVNNVEMKAGNASNYSNITIGADAKTTYNDVTITSAGGGIGAANGAEVVFNSGSVDVNSTSTSGRYLFYAEGEGTVITINGGNFDFNKTQNQKRAYIYASEGTTVYVNGGTFGKASARDGYTDGILGTGTVVITGGTFGFDPSKWVADGYIAVNNGDGTWTVTEAPVTPVAPQQVNGIYQVSKPAELAWLAASTSKINHATLTADIDMKGATISSIEIESYRTFDGNGHKISNVVVDGNGLFENTGSEITIKNITLDNVTVNATGGEYAGIVSSKFCGFFENVTVLNSTVNANNVKYVGGLAGKVVEDMVNCKVENVSVTGLEKVGGLVGFFSLSDAYSSIELKDCSAKNVTVTATNTEKSEAGVIFGRGLAPENSSWKFTFTNCSAQLKDGQKLIGYDYNSNIDTSAIAVTQ